MSSVGQQVAFWLLAVLTAAGAVRVVTARNVVHCALYLVAALSSLAALYVLLLAEFVAWAQVLVYVGAIVVLLLFGVMLTRGGIGREKVDNESQRAIAVVCALAVFALLSTTTVAAFGDREIDLSALNGTDTGDVGSLIFSTYVLPFEIVSLLLLAALIGAIVIARREET